VAVTPTTWNPADQVQTTLSGGNLVATSANVGGVRSVFSAATTGKYYWEITFTGGVPNSSLIGVAPASTNLATVNGTGLVSVVGNGAVYINSTSASGTNIGAFTAGAVLGFALDLAANLLWIRPGPASNWNGSGTANPATGVGGISLAPLISVGTALFAGEQASGINQVLTANFGASGFGGAVPAGFQPGLGVAAAVAAVQARAFILA
jgi:hypothetical protein